MYRYLNCRLIEFIEVGNLVFKLENVLNKNAVLYSLKTIYFVVLQVGKHPSTKGGGGLDLSKLLSIFCFFTIY